MAFYGKYLYQWEWVSPPLMAQAMALGTAVHKALEAFHQGRDPMTELCRHWGTITEPLAPNAFAKAVGLIRVYTADETYDPRDKTEQKFKLRIPGIDVPIIGYIDVQRGLTVRELKTTGSTTWWTPERAKESLQTGLYAMAVGKRFSGAQVTVEHHILNHHGGQFTHTPYTNSPTKAEQQACEDGIRDTWKEIQKGELVAKCKPGQCRYPTKCHEFGYVGTDSLELSL